MMIRSNRGRQHLRYGLLVLAAAFTFVLLVTSAAFAAGTYSGGVDDYPLYVPNDHTAVAIHFSASGLTPNTAYYVKIRFSPTPAPASTDNRGFTWNSVSQTWVQERSDWTLFPAITTSSTGTISGANGWLFAKFSDTRLSGPYYILASLSTGGSGNTFNGSVNAPVTIMNMATDGIWLHNSVATGIAAGKRAEVDLAPLPSPSASPSVAPTVVGLSKTEANGVTDNGDGTVDNPGTAGSFLLSAPTKTDVIVQLFNKVWPSAATGVTYTTPDVTIALGATDTTPPTAVGKVTGAAGNTTAKLIWTAADDNVGVSSYLIYRWVEPAASEPYTGEPLLIATVPATQMSFADSGLTNGTTYSYMVRATDAATNIGPRATVTVTPKLPTTVTLKSSVRTIVYGASGTLSGTLQSGTSALAGGAVQLQASPNGTAWTVLANLTSSTTGTFSHVVKPGGKTYYRVRYLGDTTHAASGSAAVAITVRVALSTPSAPLSVWHGASFAVTGTLRPQHWATSRLVKLLCEKLVGGHWVQKQWTWTRVVTASGYSKYSVSTRLWSSGHWRLRAYTAANFTYLATYSSYRYVAVK
jgi:hypothetical protein